MTAGRVVIADDNAVNRRLLGDILLKAGYEVRAAADGPEAIRLVESSPPELILLDVQMPGMSGYDVCRELRGRGRLGGIPVIFISALDEVGEKVKGFEAGGLDYVTKPFEPAEVLARAGAHVKLFRLQHELKQRNFELQRRNEQLAVAHDKTERLFLALSEALAGTVLDDTYRLDEKIGEGGFGAVFRGMHLGLQRPVAVKVLRPATVLDAREQLARFQREGIVTCRVVHPHAVEVLDFGVSSSGVAYLVMELLQGLSLGSLLRDVRFLPLPRCANIGAAVCAVLEAAHASGIVHRDVKPDNVFLHQANGGEVVKVLDFGIAKLLDEPSAPDAAVTQAGSLVGTPCYMAPERLLGRPHDARSDIYSVGVLLYVMLTGELPFAANTMAEMMQLHLTGRPRPITDVAPTLPPALAGTIMQALDGDPVRRPALSELTAALQRAG